MRHVIVDGYNVIRADSRFLALERVSLERARQVLVQTLASSPRLINDRLTVVFDGRLGTREHVHGHRLGRVELLYSARGQRADDVIIAEARREARNRPVVVVTNDREVREHCRAAGCEVSGSENLLEQMPGAIKPSRAPRDFYDDLEPGLSTVKRGNPRRSSRRSRRPQDFRF